MKSIAQSAPLGEPSGHAVVASQSVIAEIERLIRLDFPAMSEADRSSIEPSTQV
jgi:hypothetical protein